MTELSSGRGSSNFDPCLDGGRARTVASLAVESVKQKRNGDFHRSNMGLRILEKMQKRGLKLASRKKWKISEQNGGWEKG